MSTFLTALSIVFIGPVFLVFFVLMLKMVVWGWLLCLGFLLRLFGHSALLDWAMSRTL